MTKTEVIELIKSASSEEDWNNKCDQVKSACGGYPDYWFAEIIASGLANEIKAGFFMLTKQDLDDLLHFLLKPVPFKPVTICGRVLLLGGGHYKTRLRACSYRSGKV
jgi:hypothetical protein